ncbi:MAG: AAA family ATPase [Oscillospiraceae bacterium]
MIYLRSFSFPSEDDEQDFFQQQVMTCYTNYYPFQLLPKRNIDHMEFAPVTILHGGNGSGKTTVLNIIAEYLIREARAGGRGKSSCRSFSRSSVFNRSAFFGAYLEYCDGVIEERIENSSGIITSDDVFDHILDIRSTNDGIDRRRDDTIDEYYELRSAKNDLDPLEEFEEFKKMNEAKRKRSTASSYVRRHTVIHALPEQSNGESALNYFIGRIKDNGLYILDEPENSLSPDNQIKLAEYIVESARYFGCQFIISSHSPFILGISGAKIYDLDGGQFRVKSWTELNNVRQYYDFFKSREAEFELRNSGGDSL